VTTILHFGWCQLFITHLDMEEKGAAIATNITYILNMLIADIWIRMIKMVNLRIWSSFTTALFSRS